MMKLLLTLGHNSSAILVEGKKVLCGYEEERLSTVKSDSSFPSLAIKEILKHYPTARISVEEVCISHWFWSWDLKEDKYYQPKFLAANFPDAKITSVSFDNTHHDLHAKSLWNFLDGDNSGLTVVADGFGNFGECLSFYHDGRLVSRSYEVNYSLGMMYQYAIRYLGMKENQDEYKLLGYEQDVSDEFKDQAKGLIKDVSDVSINGLRKITPMKCDMSFELEEAWNYWEDTFLLVDDGVKDRAKIAYFTQQVLEKVMMTLVQDVSEEFKTKNIKVTGGVFYNVKLNNMLLRYSDKFEANPLAGDQGCALGFTDARFDHFFWGKRDIVEIAPNPEDVFAMILKYGHCEIFRGNMEFGPRALCNTTCLVAPHQSFVEEINTINGRDSVMPMAPVVTEEFAFKMFDGIEKVGKSKNFMIIAYDYKHMYDEIRGAAHYDSDRDVYTGRIQIAPDSYINSILSQFDGILINTSLNAHGQPILFDSQDYITMKHIQQRVKDDNK